MIRATSSRTRYAYLDLLRILAAFLVIVNHTIGYVFEKLAPTDPIWWVSIVWYYLSKIAVPIFVMVSGACLLPRKDTYPRALGRMFRVLLVLVIFSYGYYQWYLWLSNWTWQAALNIPQFLMTIWQGRIVDSFWYLYFYLGLMVALPILQRMVSAMGKRDMEYFMGVSFLVFAIWPLVEHYVPAVAMPQYLDIPLFGVFLGLFVAGHYLQTYAGRANRALALLVILLSLAASTWLTRIEYSAVGAGEKYWFMDERSQPSIFMILCAMGMFTLVMRSFKENTVEREASGKRWAMIGGCAFGIYLVQDWLIAETRYRFFVPLTGTLPPMVAVLIWEGVVFAAAFAAAWVLKHIPLLKKLL